MFGLSQSRGLPLYVGKAPGPGKVKEVLKKSSCSAGKRKTRKSRGLMIRPHDVKFATLETRFAGNHALT
jgi:hypothetical protein